MRQAFRAPAEEPNGWLTDDTPFRDPLLWWLQPRDTRSPLHVEILGREGSEDRASSVGSEYHGGRPIPAWAVCMSELTRVLSQIESGNPAAAEQLLPLVYDELRKLAAARIAQEAPGQTLQATALVHEAYLRLVGSPENGHSWDSRGHFFAAAAEAMRRILVEIARRKDRVKHGGGLERVDVELTEFSTPMPPHELLDLEDALVALEEEDPVKAQLVTLRFFGGMTIEQASEHLGISRVTAHRYWTYARAFLHRHITTREGGG
jgi:RNA polymerase sigma factor (TIGR02999 family)